MNLCVLSVKLRCFNQRTRGAVGIKELFGCSISQKTPRDAATAASNTYRTMIVLAISVFCDLDRTVRLLIVRLLL